KISRDIKLQEGGPVWGIFHRKENADVLNFKLPAIASYAIASDYVPNEKLIDSLWAALEKAIPKKLEHVSSFDPVEKRMAIINNYPAPVGEKLRLLMISQGPKQDGPDKPSKEPFKSTTARNDRPINR
ncbi:MAG: hypothetical protein AAF591_19170, partial [Verrucomicrobiota bacterium]